MMMQRVELRAARFSLMLFGIFGCVLAPSTSPASTSIGVSTMSFAESSGATSRSFQLLNLSHEGFRQGDLLEAALEADLSYDWSRSSLLIAEAPQAFAGTSARLSPLQLHLGRKLEGWSRLDDEWRLGIFQPRFRWDWVSPKQVGLTGAFLSFRSRYLKLTAFGSPGFIPERGSTVQFEEGSIVSSSPWFVAPPARLDLFERSAPVRYELGGPSVKEIVLHKGFAAMARVGEEEGPWASFSYAWKPMNQLFLGYEGYLERGSGDVSATIYPRVLYHRLLAADAGYSYGFLDASVSVLQEEPVRDDVPTQWNTQESSDALAVSSALRVGILKAGMMWQRGGNAPDLGPDSIAGTSRFESRYPFRRVGQVSLESSLGLLGGFGKRFFASTRLLHDFENEADVFSAELLFQPRSAWVFNLGADVLGSVSDKGFVSRIRGHDRVYGGVKYVF